MLPFGYFATVEADTVEADTVEAGAERYGVTTKNTGGVKPQVGSGLTIIIHRSFMDLPNTL